MTRDFWFTIGLVLAICVGLIVVNEVQTAREIRRIRKERQR